ncbi:MAG: hypothetical protein AABX19_03715 [Nanoarchaeota archaeon]
MVDKRSFDERLDDINGLLKRSGSERKISVEDIVINDDGSITILRTSFYNDSGNIQTPNSNLPDDHDLLWSAVRLMDYKNEELFTHGITIYPKSYKKPSK